MKRKLASVLLAGAMTVGLASTAQAALPYEEKYNLAINCDGNWIAIYSNDDLSKVTKLATRFERRGCATSIFETP